MTDREKDLEELTCRAREAFAGQGAVLATVAGVRQQLERVIAARGPIPSRGRDVSDAIRHVLEHLRKTYTMEQERLIHADFAGDEQPGSSPLQAACAGPSVTASTEEEADAFLF